MNRPPIPAAPWQPSPVPDSRAIITPDGYFLLNLEGLHYTTPENADALRRAVATLPDLLAALAKWIEHGQDIADAWDNYAMHPDTMNQMLDATTAALTKAGFTATVPQNSSCV